MIFYVGRTKIERSEAKEGINRFPMVDQGFIALGRVGALVARVQEPLVLDLNKGSGVNIYQIKAIMDGGWRAVRIKRAKEVKKERKENKLKLKKHSSQ